MARRTFTNIVLALGLLCSIAASTTVKAQQVTFAISPTQVTAAVGDTLKLNITVQNFTSIVSFQYAVEWDAALLSFIAMDSVSIPDQSNFLTNPFGGNTLLVGWNASGTAKTIATNGQRIFRLRLKVIAPSSNFWAKFSDTNTSVEVIQDPGLRSITPVFVNLGIPPGASATPVGGKATGSSTLQSQKVCVPVTTTDFTNIVSAQWVNKWNAAVLRLDSISTLNSTLGLTSAHFGITQASSGRMTFAWTSTSGPKTLNNNDTLYKVCYTAIGSNGTNSVVSFDSAAIYRRDGGSDSRIALNGVNGTVTVGTLPPPPTTSLTFVASNQVVNPNETACVDIKTGAFTDIALAQWTMHWDSLKMTLLSASSTAGIGINAWIDAGNQGDFNNLINGNPSGTLRFLWVSGSGNGVTLPDSTVLMQVCFRYIGAAGTNSTFRFDGVPQKILVKDGNLVNVTPTFRSGNVSANNAVVPVTLTGTLQHVNCSGGTDGSITLTPAGGNGTFTYSWTGPNGFTATSKDITARSAGQYFVTVTSNGVTKTDNFTITQPAILVVSAALTHVNCNAGTTGAVVTTVSGGTAGYTYNWLLPNNTTVTTKDLSNLAAGTYKLTVTDTKNCTATNTSSVTEPSLLSATTVVTHVNCNGGNNGGIVTTVSGGTPAFTYNWLLPNGSTVATKDLSNLAIGTYRLTVTDAKNCTATNTSTLTEPTLLTVSTVVTNISCGGSNGTIVTTAVGGTGPYTYSWLLGNGTTVTTKDLMNLTAGTYRLTVTDSKGCTATNTSSITEPSLLSATTVVTNVSCNGGNNGGIVTTVSGGTPAFTYNWLLPNGTTATTKDLTALTAGAYKLTVTDSRGCTFNSTSTVTEPAFLSISTAITNVSCNGGNTGAIATTISGGNPSFTYNWLLPNGSTATTQNLATLTAGTYKLTVTDTKNCTATNTSTVTEPTLLTVSTVVTNISCNGGTDGKIVTTPSGGTAPYTYNWLNPNGTTVTSKDLNNLTGGSYKLTVTDTQGCTAINTSTVAEPALFAATTVVTNIACNGSNNGTIVTTMTGGTAPFTYNWLLPNGATATTKDLSALGAGTYKLTVTDSKTCTATNTSTVTESSSLAVSTQKTNVTCKDGSNGAIVTTVSGGTTPYSYSWVGATTTPTAKDLANLTAGIYKLTVRDANNCSVLRADTITEPLAINISTVVTNVICKGGNNGSIVTTIDGGTSPFIYSWVSNGGATFASKDLTNLGADVYKLTVTDGKNCTATYTETVTEPTAISIGSATIVGTRCSQPIGKITIPTPTGGNSGYTFAWTGPNSSTFTTQNLTNVAPGAYALTVKDSKNCTFTANYTVVDTAANIVSSTPSVTNVTCNGGSNGAISLTATGSGPLTYAWTGTNGFTATTLAISNLKAGNYNLSISDAGCAKTIAAIVTEPTVLATAPQMGNVKCKGDATGTIALNATGGTGALTITWTGANGFTATGQLLNTLKAGAYTATIKDVNLCEKSETITILEPTDSLKITNNSITDIVCNGGTGAIALIIGGGTPQYNYAWTGVGGFNSNQRDISAPRAGDYRVSVTDANACRVERLFTVKELPAVTINVGTTDAGGTPNGTISITPAGGRLPYTYLWTGQGVTPTAQNQTGLCSGTYTVTVKDSLQCSATKSVTVGGSCSTPMRTLGTPAIMHAGCAGQNLGKITVNWEGGVAPFTIVWVQIIGGNPTNILNDAGQARTTELVSRPAGFYAVKITDAIGQTLATSPMEVKSTVTPATITAAIANETCRGNDGSIILTIADVARPYKLVWLDDNTKNDVEQRLDLRARSYSLTLTDDNRCIKDMGGMVVKRTPCPLTIASIKVNPTCFGGTNGSITINISNGEPIYTLTLPSGQTTTINNVNTRTGTYTLSNLGAGTYAITVKDTTNPAQIITVTLESPQQLLINKTLTGDQGTCTGSIVLGVTGGVLPYTYRWNTGATSRDLFNLCCNDGRRYSVSVTDANACPVSTFNDSITCNIATLSLDSSIVRNPLCKSDSTNSRIDVFVHGGVVPIIYEWRNQAGTVVGTNSPILLNQPPGHYYLAVVDSRVPNPQRLVFDAVLRTTSTLGITNIGVINAADNLGFGTVSFNIIPGGAPYTVRWPDGSTTTTQTTSVTNSAIRVGTGEYTVTDIQGCVVKATIQMNSNACATLRTNTIYYTARDTFNIRCAKNCDAGATILSLSADYALPIRSYQWTSGEVGPTAFKLCPGINQVTVTDANGKTCTSRVFMKAPAVLKDTVWVDDKLRTMESIATGGVPPYKYRWTTDNADTTRKVTVIRTGRYVVLVTDALGCDALADGIVDPEVKCLEAGVILTPNDDGRNENFRIKACDYKKVRLEVYNRWGQLVYSSNDYREQWYGNKEDGQFGDPLPDGVYMYILSAIDSAGKQQLGKGTVNIVRN